MSNRSVYYYGHKKLPLSLSIFSRQSGFTLIELMVVMAIVGILSAIGIFSYQTYIRQTQLITVYQEINQFRLPYQEMMDSSSSTTNFSLSNLSIPIQTKYCQFSLTAPDGTGAAPNALRCQIQNLNYLNNQHISLNRRIDGKWECEASVGISSAYLPQACR